MLVLSCFPSPRSMRFPRAAFLRYTRSHFPSPLKHSITLPSCGRVQSPESCLSVGLLKLFLKIAMHSPASCFAKPPVLTSSTHSSIAAHSREKPGLLSASALATQQSLEIFLLQRTLLSREQNFGSSKLLAS